MENSGMVILKSYCYSEQELDFVIAQLVESEGFIDKYLLYEFDVTHRGRPKPFRFKNILDQVPKNLRNRLIYRPVSVKDICIETDDPEIAHSVNERIQRSYFLNDSFVKIGKKDVIIEVDVDEIVYRSCYPILIFLAKVLRIPLSFRMNQFYYKKFFLWKNIKFRSPVIYSQSAYFKREEILESGFKISKNRDYPVSVPWPCGAHFSWVMSPKKMLRKLKSYAHSEYEVFADIKILTKAIEDKKYIFDDNTDFQIQELKNNDKRIPIYLRSSRLD